MKLKGLLDLIATGNLKKFRTVVQNLSEPIYLETFENGDTLFHKLIGLDNLAEEQKVKYIYVLSDLKVDINAQNNEQRTCLHLAIIKGLCVVAHCLLQNGADLTITDFNGLCAYNHARRLSDKDMSKKIITKMQGFYPTYWIGIENSDIKIIRSLVNSWCRFDVKKNGKTLVDFAREKKFKGAFSLFKSLEPQMDLCSAVFALNVPKVKKILSDENINLKMNFKNMKENGATIMYYAIKENDFELLEALLKYQPNILNDYMNDEHDIDYPIYFAALDAQVSSECLKLLTPRIDESNVLKPQKLRQPDLSHLSYKGMSFLRYAIQMDVDKATLKELLSSNYCSKELITLKDPEYLTPKQYALKAGKKDYADLIDEVCIEYALNEQRFRKQLAANGFDFYHESMKINGENLLEHAQKSGLGKEVCAFLENVEEYQKKMVEFHRMVEKNDFNAVKCSYSLDDMPLKGDYSELKATDLFVCNLILTKKKDESQSIIHKCSLNGYYEILNMVLDILIKEETLGDRNIMGIGKFDDIRDHSYRTPMHYASGAPEYRRIAQLLSQFGFSDNVFDKDGMTPLDFSERMQSEELQELIKMHKEKTFAKEEPNPWTWQVWTRIQREKDTLKQLISIRDPNLTGQHGHGHGHSHGGHGHSHSHGHSHAASHESADSQKEDADPEDQANCSIL